MKLTLSELILLGLIAASANIVGGLILLPSGIHKRLKSLLKYFLAIGAGFMLAVNFIEIFPRIINLWSTNETSFAHGEKYLLPMLLVLGGYLLTQFFEHTIAPHFHLGEEVHSKNLISVSTAYTAIGGLLIHTFFDGVSIAAASRIDSQAGILVFIAVFLHKFPEGFTIASMVLAAGLNFRQVFIANALVGLTTLIGILVFLLIGQNSDIAVSYALPIAGGVSLYVAASDLIPEVNHHGGKRPLVSIFVFAGVALFFVIHYLLHIIL